MNIEQIIKVVAERAGITAEQARKAVEAMFGELKSSDDEKVRKVANAALATMTATLVTTVMHKA